MNFLKNEEEHENDLEICEKKIEATLDLEKLSSELKKNTKIFLRINTTLEIKWSNIQTLLSLNKNTLNDKDNIQTILKNLAKKYLNDTSRSLNNTLTPIKIFLDHFFINAESFIEEINDDKEECVDILDELIEETTEQSSRLKNSLKPLYSLIKDVKSTGDNLDHIKTISENTQTIIQNTVNLLMNGPKFHEIAKQLSFAANDVPLLIKLNSDTVEVFCSLLSTAVELEKIIPFFTLSNQYFHYIKDILQSEAEEKIPPMLETFKKFVNCCKQLSLYIENIVN